MVEGGKMTYFMFKQLSILAAIGLVAAGCSIKEDRSHCFAPVTVHVNDFQIAQEAIPDSKATAVGSTSAVKAITLAFYTPAGAEQYKHTQVKNDASTYLSSFGDFTFSLPFGSYTMVVLGYAPLDSSPLSLSSSTVAEYTGAHALETLVATKAVVIEDSSPLILSATLSRINAMLQVITTDGKSANANNVQMTLSGGSKSFNPTSGLATDNGGFVNTVGISAAVGSPSTSNSVLFLTSDEQTMNVTIDVLNADGESISQKVVTGVPFKRNCITKLTGSLYSVSGSAGSFLVDTDWGEPIEMTF